MDTIVSEYDQRTARRQLLEQARRLSSVLPVGRVQELAKARQTRRRLVLEGQDDGRVWKWYRAWAKATRAKHKTPAARTSSDYRAMARPLSVQAYGLDWGFND